MSTAKTVMILGGSTMQLPAIRIARRKGWRVVVADGNPAAEGRALADEFVTVDLKDRPGLEAAARAIRESGGLDGVFTAGTDFSSSVAWVAERLGLPGIPYEAALLATDKSRMREAFARNGVPHPRFARLGAGDDPAAALSALAFPLVVKPVDSMGARGVCRVDSVEALRVAHRQAAGFSRAGAVIVEEYMEGPELSLDAIVYRGEVTICGVADRHIFFPPFFVEMGHTMPSALDPALLAQAETAFRAGIHALGIEMGAAKGDVKVTSRGPMIGEIAARLSGGYMSGWTFPYASGVEVTEAGLNVAAGLPPGDLRPRASRTSAERAFISLPGVVAEIRGLAEAAAVPAVRNVFVRTPTGLRDAALGDVPDVSGLDVVFPTNNVQKCGNVITQAETREEAVARAHEAIQRILVRLRPDVAATTAFLFDHATRVPDAPAYTLRTAGARAALEAMPLRQGGGERLSYLPLDVAGEAEIEDWHGKKLRKALAEIREITGVGPREGAGGLCLGRRFWQAVLAGGVQGAVYFVDTLRARMRSGLDVAHFLGG
jgi:biotin carboxylase